MRHIKFSAVVNDDQQLESLAVNIAKAIKKLEEELGEADAEITVSVAPILSITRVVKEGDDDLYDEEDE